MANGQATFPGLPFDGFRIGRPGPDGSFTFGDISPGQYTVIARGMRPVQDGAPPGTPAQIVWATSDVTIDGDNISGLALLLEPGLVVAGQVRFESATQKPAPDVKALRVSLQAVQTQGAATIAPNAAAPDANGQFRLAGATPGRYRMSATGPGVARPGGWFLKSAMVNGQDTLDLPFVLQPNQSISDAVLTLTDRLAQLTGTVQTAAGAPAAEFTVVLFPVDQTLWVAPSRRIQAVRPSADASYTCRNLPAGDYYVAWWSDGARGVVRPGLPPALAQGATGNHYRREQKVHDIRLGPPANQLTAEHVYTCKPTMVTGTEPHSFDRLRLLHTI